MPHVPLVTRVCLGCLLLGLLAPSPAAAREWTLDDFVQQRSPWDGFPVGTMVHTRRTQDIRREGEEKPTRRVDEVKKTLFEWHEDRVVLEVSRRVAGTWRKTRQVIPLRDLSEVKVEEIGVATLRVGDRDYFCTKSRVRRPGPRGPESTVLWVHAKVGILKIQMETPSPSTLETTKVEEEVEAAGRTFEARVFEVEAGRAKAGRLHGTTTLSREVPGAIVKERIVAEGGDTPLETVTELVAFEIPEAREAPETPEKPENPEEAPEKAPPQDGKPDAPDR